MKLIMDNKAFEGTADEMLTLLKGFNKAPVPASNEPMRVKREYNKKRKHVKWTGVELDIIANNMNMPLAKLGKLLPRRTKSAINTVRWEFRHNRLSKARTVIYSAYLRLK